MKREILFRVYDLDSKKYLKGDFSIGVESGEIRGKYGEVFENLIIEQFTGLTDKKGVKIFENDKTNYGTIIFKYGCFGINRSNGFVEISNWNLSHIEIIGNIHE